MIEKIENDKKPRRSRGSIVKKGSRYYVVIDIPQDSVTGKRKRKWVTVKGGSRDAEKVLTKYLHQKDTDTFVEPTKTDFSEYLAQWLQAYAKPKLARRSFDRYTDIISKYINPKLGKIKLNQLTPGQIQTLYSEWLGKGLSNATVRYHHAVIHNALRSAVKWGLVGRNICDAVEIPKKRRIEMQIWTAGEMAQFLEFAKSNKYYELWYLALSSGMRRGELLGLQWADINLDIGELHVDRGLQQYKDSTLDFTLPKTEKSRRTIALPPSTIQILKDYKNRMALKKAARGKIQNETDLVFCHDNGKPVRPNTITYAWKFLVKKSGLKPIRLHDARHSFASLLLSQGVHPKIVQEILGHATISQTLDTYSHVAPGLQRKAMEQFDEIFKH